MSDLATLQSLQAQLAALIAAQTPDPVPAISAEPAPVTWPQYVTVNNGTTYQVMAPLNPAYGGSITDLIYGKPPHFVFEPSNGAKYNKPLRSANGWPMYYDANGVGSVLYSGQTFPNDAAVATFIAATTPTAAQQAATDAAWSDLYSARASGTAAKAPAKQKNKPPHANPRRPATVSVPNAPPVSTPPAPPVIVQG